MDSLDQAYLLRQGLSGQERGGWGRRFFSALDTLYPEWKDRDKEVYLAATRILYGFAHGQCHPLTSSSIFNKPESLVRMVILLLKSNLLRVEV